jgi:hypothetical protein
MVALIHKQAHSDFSEGTAQAKQRKGKTMNKYDPAGVFAHNLLIELGISTAIRIDHSFGRNKIEVKVARTGNVLATIELRKVAFDGLYWNGTEFWLSLNGGEFEDYSLSGSFGMSLAIRGMKRFPKPRNNKRAWSPIVLTDSAKEQAEITRNTIANYAL